MGKIPPRDVVARIVNPLVYRDDGMTLDEVVAVFPDSPPRSQVERWLADLVAAGLLSLDRTKKPPRYFTEDPAYAFTTWADRAANAAVSGGQGGPEPVRKPVDSSAEAGVAKASIPGAIKSGIKTENGSESSTMKPAIKSDDPAVGGAPNAVLHSENGSKVGPETQPPGPAGESDNGGVTVSGNLPSAGSLAASDAGFSAIMDGALLAFVVGALPPTSAMARLQGLAARAVSDPAKRLAFVKYGMKRLSHLTSGECARLGIQPEQYEIWRRQYFHVVPAGSASGPASSPPRVASATSDNEPTSPGNAVRTGPAKAPAENDVVVQKLAALIDAALPTSGHSPASSRTDQEEDGGSVAARKSVTESAPAAVSKATLNAVAKALVDAVGRFIPGGMSPATRTASIGMLGAVLVGLLHLVGASGWILAVGMTVVAAALVVGWIALHFLSPSKEPSGMQAADSSMDSTTTPPAPTPSSHPRRTAILVAILVVFAVAAGLGSVLFLKARTHPSSIAIETYLVADCAPIPVRVAALDVTYGQTGNAGGQVSFRAVIETTEPLYRRLETDAYLQTHAPAEIAAIDAAAALLLGPSGDRLRSAAGPAPVPDYHTLLLLSTQTPPRTAIVQTGILFAWRRDGEWAFTPDSNMPNRTRFAGEPKPAVGDALAVDLPADAARLKALLAEQVAYANKVQAAAQSLAAELDRERAERMSTFAEMLRPGNVFAGTVVNAMRGESHRVALEIVDSSAGGQISAALHNDGGWIDARPFTGNWAMGSETDRCVVTLKSRGTDRIPDAGPLIEDYGETSVVLQVRVDGTAVGTPLNWQLHRVDPNAVADLKADFIRDLIPALEATKTGLIYRGIVTRKQGGAETLVLRFTDQNADGTALRATLESVGVPARVRPFRGAIMGNTYRAAGAPIRLRSADADRSLQADPNSPLGLITHADNYVIALRVEGSRLVGEDARFIYEFTPADSTSVTIDQMSTSEPKTQNTEPRTGKPAPTAAPQPQTPNSEPQTAAATAAADRRQEAGVGDRRSDSELRTQNPEPKTEPAAKPLFGDADVQEILLRSLKTFSMQPGAYVFFEGGWVPLPKNNGRWVRTLAQAANGKLADLKRWEDKIAGKPSADAQPTASNEQPALSGLRPQTPNPELKTAPLAPPAAPAAYILFDGRKRVPAVSGKNLTLLFVGELPAVPSEVLAQHPDLKTYPLVEVAPMKTLSNGSRLAPLVEIAPGVLAFGSNRIDAMIETPGEGVAFLRCTVPLAPGHYALSAGTQSFEVNVE